MANWLYEHSLDGAARYVLGEVGTNPLVFFGINPSTAKPGALDPTVTRVRGFAADNNFDGWIMLNIYPQISTDPDGLHQMMDPDLKAQNEEWISDVVGGRPLTVVGAWGDLVEKRKYLRTLVSDICQLPSLSQSDWRSLGKLTNKKNPRHPLYQPKNAVFTALNISAYVESP